MIKKNMQVVEKFKAIRNKDEIEEMKRRKELRENLQKKGIRC